MTTLEMIGQRIVAGFFGYECTEEFKEIIRKYKVGNAILFRENIRDEAQLKRLCRQIQELVISETGHPAFIMIDQEGGMVSRLPENMCNIPGAMAIAATGKPENAYVAGKYTGRQLRLLGTNFNLAPVLDVNSNPDNPIIGCRSYGETPDVVSEYSLKMVRGLDETGVLSCGKHFPGHGDVSVDSHLDLPRVDKTLEELEALELIPFKAAIDQGIPAIMTAHILFPEIEKDKIPATMSRTMITDVLRKRLGFKGMVLTDCLEMQAIQKFYGVENGALAAIKAGTDIVMISHTPALVAKTVPLIVTQLENGEISMEEMKESVERILDFKKRYLDDVFSKKESAENSEYIITDSDRETIEDIRRQTLTLVSKADFPLKTDANTLYISPTAFNAWRVGNEKEDVESAFCEILRKELGGKALVISSEPDDSEIEESVNLAKESSFVVVGTYNAHMFKRQIELIRKVHEINPKIAVFALRNPYELYAIPDDIWKYAAFEYTTPMIKHISELLHSLR